ncbi:MAG: hypothetical protein UZ15_CFX003002043 [Chloroflexi bacterium OLB15]|nr:MAG: hypothetical protein UZ15_CFX003002043 [Chloroflexi bacterium OLB15]
MRGADELQRDVETLAEEYAALIGGVQEDGYIDNDEAILGGEYAEEYRKKLQALRKEAQGAIKEIRATYRQRMKEARASAVSIGRGRELANQLGDERVDVTNPYYAVLLRLDRLLAEARLTKATFQAAHEKLSEIGAASVLIPQMLNISVDDDDADDESLAQMDNEESADNESASQFDDALREVAGRWQAMWSEANDRLLVNTHPKQASHLRGIMKALELALQDVDVLVNGQQTE